MPVEAADVKLFTGPGCSHCEAAKRLLTEYRVEFLERSVDDPAELTELQRRLPRARSLPQVFVDSIHIGNDDDLRARRSEGRVPFAGAP